MLLSKEIKQIATMQDIRQFKEFKKENILKQYQRIHDYKNSKKQSYNNIIPLKIYQTWHTKALPPKMQLNVDSIKNSHPRFEYFLFDDDDCRNFIKDNFESDVLHAFDSLVPGAYKADLWRYCILYINGGIYLDIKYSCINGFHFIELTEKEHFVFDINKYDIYNALIAVVPKNIILFNCIRKIVENVKNKYYGNGILDPTGPALLASFLSSTDKKNIDLDHIFNKPHDKFILYNNIAILKMYRGFYGEQAQFQKTQRYTDLWAQRKIYV